MTKKAAVEERKQGKTTHPLVIATRQLMLPLLMAVQSTKDGLLAFVLASNSRSASIPTCVMRNVKRWRDESMMRRWVALGITEAQWGFRRVKGFRHMLVLVAALRPNAKVQVTKKVA